jgi:hypothetical protein
MTKGVALDVKGTVLPGGRNFDQKAQKRPNFGQILLKVAEKGPKNIS